MQNEVEKTFTMKDGIFTFWTAKYGLWPDGSEHIKVFRVRSDTTPKERAEQRGMRDFIKLRPAYGEEILDWIATHNLHNRGW